MEHDIIQRVYGKGAHEYEEIMAKYWPAPRKEFIEALGFREGQRVLSAVVGTGLDLPYFPEGVHVTGIDITPERMQELQHQIVQDFYKSPQWDRRMTEMAKNFPKLRQSIEEFRSYIESRL